MTEIDTRKIKPGDYVTLKAKVVKMVRSIETLHVVMPTGAEIWVAPENIAAHESAPEPLKVGDVVTALALGTLWVVIALDNDTAWLKLPNYSDRYTYMRTSDLRRVEQP
jgi:hypothetical protein